MSNFNQNLRKKLLYRSLNRGCRETDILLGQFASQEIPSMPDSELAIYEQFLDEYDGDIYKWLTKQASMPEEYRDTIGKKLLEFCYSSSISCHPSEGGDLSLGSGNLHPIRFPLSRE